jgi:Spy/CpxP family protein refolding chaperone
MNKKIIAISLTLALPLTVAAFPGDKCAFEGWHANRIERLTKSLDLNAEQKTKLEAIFKEREAKFKAAHDETHTRLQAVLTKEQMAKMDDMKKQRLEKWQKKHEALKDQKTPEPTK